MADELREEYEKRLKAAPQMTAPKVVQKLDKLLERLRLRLKHGDPDLSRDDIQAAIDRVEREKLQALHDAGQGIKPDAKNVRMLYAALPNLAKLYERRIMKGLTGTGVHVAKARHLLLELFGGHVDLTPTPHGLVARSELRKDVLLRGHKLYGSGGIPRQWLA